MILSLENANKVHKGAKKQFLLEWSLNAVLLIASNISNLSHLQQNHIVSSHLWKHEAQLESLLETKQLHRTRKQEYKNLTHKA